MLQQDTGLQTGRCCGRLAAVELHSNAWLSKADAYHRAHHIACNIYTQGCTTKQDVCELCRCWTMCCRQVIVHDGLQDGIPCNLLQPVYAATDK